MKLLHVWIVMILLGSSVSAPAQWVNQRTPGTSRTKDGKPILSAPAPRGVSGKPDLSGVWEVESSTRKELEPFLLPGGENGLGEDDSSKYFLNFFSDFPFGQEPFQPAAAALFREHMQRHEKSPSLCPMPSVPVGDLPTPFKIVHTPGLIVLLYEGDTNFRQIFTDARKLPADPQPSWMGYSVGKWEGDWLVVDTVGFNDKSKLDAMGHFHSENMHLTERFHRRDFGHMELQITIDDPKTYTKPVTIKVSHRLLPDTDLLESFCAENEKDEAHIAGQ